MRKEVKVKEAEVDRHRAALEEMSAQDEAELKGLEEALGLKLNGVRGEPHSVPQSSSSRGKHPYTQLTRRQRALYSCALHCWTPPTRIVNSHSYSTSRDQTTPVSLLLIHISRAWDRADVWLA